MRSAGSPELAAIGRKRRMWQLWTIALGLLATAGVVIALLNVAPPALRHDGTGWQTLRILGSTASLALIVSFVVIANRTGHLRAQRQSILWLIPWAERRRLVAHVRRGEAPPGVDRDNLRAAAQMMQRVRLTSVLLAGIGLNLLASASLWESRIVWAIAAGLVALLAGFLALGLRDASAADRYLADHDG